MAYTATTPTVLDIRFDLAAPAPGVNPYSARGLRGTLAPIAAAQGDALLARTVNKAPPTFVISGHDFLRST